jgi:hypothetical protein
MGGGRAGIEATATNFSVNLAAATSTLIAVEDQVREMLVLSNRGSNRAYFHFGSGPAVDTEGFFLDAGEKAVFSGQTNIKLGVYGISATGTDISGVHGR